MLSHMKLFANGWMPWRMAGKRHVPLSQWSPNIGDRTSEICPWTYAQYFMHGNCYRSRSLSSKWLTFPHQHLGETKSSCKVNSTPAQQWPKSHACSSCNHPSVELEKWRQCIPRSRDNSEQVIYAFIWLSECWVACPDVTEEQNCTAQSEYSESHASHVLQLKWICAWPSHANWYSSQWSLLLLTLTV